MNIKKYINSFILTTFFIACTSTNNESSILSSTSPLNSVIDTTVVIKDSINYITKYKTKVIEKEVIIPVLESVYDYRDTIVTNYVSIPVTIYDTVYVYVDTVYIKTICEKCGILCRLKKHKK
jgi:hypothetical protein